MLVVRAVKTPLSSFTAPRGPLSPLGNANGICKLLRYSANIEYCYNFIWVDWNIFIIIILHS